MCNRSGDYNLMEDRHILYKRFSQNLNLLEPEDEYGQAKLVNRNGYVQNAVPHALSIDKRQHGNYCHEDRINIALARLRNELLELKRQDTNLYRHLKSIDSQIQRIKSEVKVEEEKKLNFSDDEEDDSFEIHDTEVTNNKQDKNAQVDIVKYESGVTHERYDSGIQADDNEVRDENYNIKYDIHRVYADEEPSGYGKTESCQIARDSQTTDDLKRDGGKYTTFVLTAPKRSTMTKDALYLKENRTKQSGKNDFSTSTPPCTNASHDRRPNSCSSKERRRKFQTRSDEYLYSRSSMNFENDREESDLSLARVNPTEQASHIHRDNTKRASARQQGITSTMSLMNIYENGELMLQDRGTGAIKSAKARKNEVEAAICSTIDTLNGKRARSAREATYAGKSCSNIDLRSVGSRRRDQNLLFERKNAVSLSDLRQQSRNVGFEGKSCGFAPVPGQRNTLPLSKTASIELVKVNGQVDVTKEMNILERSHVDNNSFKRSYSLSSKRHVSLNSLNDNVGFYRTPSGENLQEHTLAYYNAARSVPRSVSVASLV